MNKKEKKLLSNKKTDYYYSMFWELYNPETMIIGGHIWLSRIENKYYSWIKMRQLCVVMKWFLDNYYSKNSCCRLDIYHTGLIPNYISRKNRIISKVISSDTKDHESFEWGNDKSKNYVPSFMYKYVYKEDTLIYETENHFTVEQLKHIQ